MATNIVFADGTTFACPQQAKAPIQPHPRERDWLALCVSGSISAIREAFVDDAAYARQWDSAYTDENGVEQTEVQEQDLSAYCVAGDIVDHRDGTFTVYMGRRTELELTQEALDVALLEILGGEV